MKLPSVWNEKFTDYINNQLELEAAKAYRVHQLVPDKKWWQKKRDELREKIWHSLGTGVDHGLDLDYRESSSIKMDGYTVKNITYQSRPGFHVTGNLYIPDGKGPFPAVINMHGHWSQGRLAERVQSRGHSLAKNGYVCLAVDAFGSGERATAHGVFEYHGANLGASLMNIGETLMGMQLADNMRGVDLLCSLKYVDRNRIGATGASGGGNQTMWLSAMDERIAAAVPVVSVGSFESYVNASNCICELLPDGLTFTEESGVLALIAPHALKICNCLGDSNPTFFPSEMLRTFAETRKIYQIYDHADGRLSYQIFNLPHGYWPKIREAMLGWFDLHLKDIGHGQPKNEAPFETLQEDELMFYKKCKRDRNVVSIAEFCTRQGNQLRKQYLQRDKFEPETEIKKLTTVLRLVKPLALSRIHEYGKEYGWGKYVLETECGRMIPLLVKPPVRNSHDYFVLCHPEGKEKLAGSRLLEDVPPGKGIILFDLYGSGETGSVDQQPALYHTLARSLLWLGRTVIGEWVKDINIVSDFARTGLGARKITVGGAKDAGVAALFAAALSKNIAGVELFQSPVSYLFSGKSIPPDFFSMAIHLPGFLNWGDISLAAGLAKAHVRFLSPVKMDGSCLSIAELKYFEKEFADIHRKCGKQKRCEFVK